MRRSEARCLSCNSHCIGYPLAAVSVPEGGLYVQVQREANRDSGRGHGFHDLIVVDKTGRFLGLEDVDDRRGLCLDCGAGWSA